MFCSQLISNTLSFYFKLVLLIYGTPQTHRLCAQHEISITFATPASGNCSNRRADKAAVQSLSDRDWIEFSFDHLLDEAFQIDIKKSQIILNESLYDHILDFLAPARRAAVEVYRKGRKARTAEVAKTAHDSSNRNIRSKEGEMSKPAIQSIDQTTGEAELINTQGTVRLKLKITSAAKPFEVHVQPVDSIDDGLLWEPCLIDGHCGVRINTSHPYYGRVYLPNLAEGVTIQGMDALLWGISIAELNCISDATKSSFGELRYEVSRNLRKLVQDLPETPENE